MHEFSICQSIVETAISESGRLVPPAKKVLLTRVVVGRYRAVVEESLKFAYETLTKGTLAEGSLLEIKPAEGRELYLESLEVEQDER